MVKSERKKRRIHEPALIEAVLARVNAGEPVAKVAASAGIAESMIYNWRANILKYGAPGKKMAKARAHDAATAVLKAASGNGHDTAAPTQDAAAVYRSRCQAAVVYLREAERKWPKERAPSYAKLHVQIALRVLEGESE